MNRFPLVLLVGALVLPSGCDLSSTRPGALAVSIETLPFAPVGFDYVQRMYAEGGSGEYEWAVAQGSDALPEGLTLTPDGRLTGVPTAWGVYELRVRVSSVKGRRTAERSLTLTVPPVLSPAQICSEFPQYAVPTFAHPGMTLALRRTLGIFTPEYVTCSDVSGRTFSLGVDGDGVQSLVGMQNLTGLTRLGLANNLIADIGPLSGLTDLEYLDLRGNQLTDIGPLAELTSLWGLVLDDNSITDVSALAGLTELRTLIVSRNQLTDVDALGGLGRLWRLWMSENQVRELDALATLDSLQELQADGNFIGDLSGLNGLARLRFLNLDGNAVLDVGPLAGLPSLEFLRIENNAVADLSPLAGLSELYLLRVGSNSVSDLTPLGGLSRLRHLHLDGNAVADLAPLGALTLEQLDLDGNAELADIGVLIGGGGLVEYVTPRVFLRSTGVSCADVAVLEQRAIVYSDCP